MFLFVGGIQPKTVVIDESPRICPVCGLAQARLKRVDQCLSLFFIPVLTVKRGRSILACDRCGAVSSAEENSPQSSPPLLSGGRTCPACGRPVEPSFNYCPQCGRRI
ncbi:MAG: zinc ribbon domain-containing protein [Syntrophobacteraceae bacterium]